MSQPRLYLHIGLQKTGTSYLQQIFWQSLDSLREQGLVMVPESKQRTFWLMLDVRGRVRRFDPAEAGRAVERLPGELTAEAAYTALVSEESLAAADDAQIQRLLAACAGREVHVVLTVRDVARHVPSAWQQLLQSGSAETFPDYLERLQAGYGEGGPLWQNADAAHVLDRWSRYVPAERIHVVTVPPTGSDPQLLLRRFCSVVGVAPERLNTTVGRANRGLMHVHAELLRRVNGALDHSRWRRDLYGDVGKRLFAIRVLGEGGGEPLRTPRRLEQWCLDVAADQVRRLRAGGYDIVGDLDDLVPSGYPFADADLTVSETALNDAAVRALAMLLQQRMDELREKRSGKARAAGRSAGTPPATAGPVRRILARIRGIAAHAE